MSHKKIKTYFLGPSKLIVLNRNKIFKKFNIKTNQDNFHQKSIHINFKLKKIYQKIDKIMRRSM